MTKEDFLKIGLTEEQAEKAAAAWTKELEGYVAKGEYDGLKRQMAVSQTLRAS